MRNTFKCLSLGYLDRLHRHAGLWPIWGQSVCLFGKCSTVLLTDDADQWKRNVKREWGQAGPQRLRAYSSIIQPTCAPMCPTQAGSGSRVLGQPEPATWSSALWLEISRQDADMQKSAWEVVCVCVRAWEQTVNRCWVLRKEAKNNTKNVLYLL